MRPRLAVGVPVRGMCVFMKVYHNNGASVRCQPCGYRARLRSMPKDIRRQISNRMRELRAKRGLTQQELAEAANLDYKTIQRLEGKKARFYPNVDTLERVAKALKVSVSKLLDFP